jgi:hypothetical protein
MSFAEGDRRRIQVVLNLPISQLSDGSDLAMRMSYVEGFDATNGTAIVTDILSHLTAIDELGDALEESYQDGSASAASVSVRVDEFAESQGFGAGRTLAASYQERIGYHIQAIRRDLGYGAGALGGRIPVM